MNAPFLVRDSETGSIEIRHFNYEGPVSKKAWQSYNRAFMKLEAARYFFPEDGMDAYHEGLKAVEQAGERIASGEIVLRAASPDTYASHAGRFALLHFHERRVLPIRRAYREVEKMTDSVGATGVDSLDIDNFDFTALSPSVEMRTACRTQEEEVETPEMTARELGELLPGIPSGQTRIRLARNILETLFPLLSEETARAFHGYLKADGNFVEAARIARISKTKYYRLWPKWIRAAKEIGEKHLVYCH